MLLFAFEAISKGSVCEAVKLEIEHKPMRAELHCSLPLTSGKLDLVAFYDNHGHDPTISYPVNIRISSEKGK